MAPYIRILQFLFFISSLAYLGNCLRSKIHKSKIGGIDWPFVEKPHKNWNFTEKNLNRGPYTYPIPICLFLTNRERLCKELKEDKNDVPERSLVLLEGGNISQQRRFTTFRQESYFTWTFGVEESGFVGGIQVDSCKSVLFAPHLDDYNIWSGRNFTKEGLIKKYLIDEVDDLTKLERFLHKLQPSVIFILSSNPHAFSDLSQRFKVNSSGLKPVMNKLRVIKTTLEQEVLHYVANASSDAHKFLMKSVRPGMFEYQLESLFNHYAYFRRGCRFAAYTGIAGSGPNAAVLHYVKNNRKMNDGDMCLIDMGAEYFCYGSDVTRTIPVNGKFSRKQKVIYDAVLNASKTAQTVAKPGTHTFDMNLLARKTILYHLKKEGLLKGDVDAVAWELGGIFMPHGLSHHLGLDVHDPRSRMFNFPSYTLKDGMYFTIEPGCYFIDSLIERAYENPLLAAIMVKEKIDEYRGFGGVRIEDDFLVTSTGLKKFSKVPTTTEEIEEFMAKSKVM